MKAVQIKVDFINKIIPDGQIIDLISPIFKGGKRTYKWSQEFEIWLSDVGQRSFGTEQELLHAIWIKHLEANPF